MLRLSLESQPSLRTLWLVTVLCVQSQALATSVAVCGSCTWSVEAGLLQKDGECQDDCFGRLEMDNKGISSISSGSFSGLPLLQELSLGNNELVTLPEGLFQALPQLRYLSLRRNPLVGLPNGTFASTFKLRTLFVDHTGIGCVPADRIPDDASIEGAVRCPTDCEIGTVYNASADYIVENNCTSGGYCSPAHRSNCEINCGCNAAGDASGPTACSCTCRSCGGTSGVACPQACIHCPAGLKPIDAHTTRGGDGLGLCVRELWNMKWIATCGNCAFWRERVTGNLRRTGHCETDCRGTLSLSDMGIVSLSDGVFNGLPRLQRLDLDDNELTRLPDHVFSNLTQMEGLVLNGNALLGLSPATFAGTTALKYLRVRNTGLGCVPIVAKAAAKFEEASPPDSLYIQGADRCPDDCETSTVYDGSACIPCPAGKAPMHHNTLGGDGTQMCLPAGWDVSWLAECGSCAFWRTQEQASSQLRRTGSCEADCKGTLNLAERGIASISDGALDGLPLVRLLYLDGNRLAALSQGVFRGLEGVVQVHLPHNQLSYLPSGVFSALQNLEHLNLAGNQLTNLPDDVFQGLDNLQTLIVEGNQLSNLPQSLLSRAHLRRVELDSKSLLCDDAGVSCSSLSVSNNFHHSFCHLRQKMCASV